MRDEDYSGAVTSSRTLLEYTFKDIYYQITGDNLEKIDDLQDGFRKIQKILKLDYDKNSHESKRKILASYVTIISSLSPLFNTLGDRHASKSTAHRNTALFCTDSTKIFVNFMYGRMQDIHGIYPSIYDRLIKLLDSELRLKEKEIILSDKYILDIVSLCDDYLSGLLLKRHINEASINSFRESDIYFSFLTIFSDIISENNLLEILEKHKHNSQAIGMKKFLDNLRKENAEIFSDKVSELINEFDMWH